MKNIFTAFTLFLFAATLTVFADSYRLSSPNGQIVINIAIDDFVEWTVSKGEEVLVAPSKLFMEFEGNRKPGVTTRVRRTDTRTVNQTIEAAVPVKERYITDHFNELVISTRDNYNIEFRAYDSGVAYRFVTSFRDREIEVLNERVEYNFTANHRMIWAIERSPTFQSHFENYYQDMTLAELGSDQYGNLPFYVQTAAGTIILLTEADLYDYSNLFLFGTGSNALTSRFPKVITASRTRGDRQEIIETEAPYIAKTAGSRSFPWRVVIVAENDSELFENNLVYKLSRPNVLASTDWIKPGKVAWDWWNANNIYGVDFRSGINTQTYKYYIDFASEFGLDYIILDEGWSTSTLDLTGPNPNMDLDELFAYAKQKNVGIVLWVLWNALDKDIEGTLDLFAEWGAVGIKVDFMVRADQDMVNYFEAVAKAAADRKLLVNFHGNYKPVGLNRKYPNVLSYEGVKGGENHKWSDENDPVHNVTIPFTRMVAGPMDYTPGAMVNANKQNYAIRYTQPMSSGTRAHQAAMYVMYESPMQMFCDNPSNYLREPEYTRWMAQMPVVWDRTVGLDSKVGEYAAVARKNGNKWYIGAMTNWDARDMVIVPDFLDNKRYRVDYIKDGINADKHASDHVIGSMILNPGQNINISMSTGGGWIAILTPLD